MVSFIPPRLLPRIDWAEKVEREEREQREASARVQEEMGIEIGTEARVELGVEMEIEARVELGVEMEIEARVELDVEMEIEAGVEVIAEKSTIVSKGLRKNLHKRTHVEATVTRGSHRSYRGGLKFATEVAPGGDIESSVKTDVSVVANRPFVTASELKGHVSAEERQNLDAQSELDEYLKRGSGDKLNELGATGFNGTGEKEPPLELTIKVKESDSTRVKAVDLEGESFSKRRR